MIEAIHFAYSRSRPRRRTSIKARACHSSSATRGHQGLIRCACTTWSVTLAVHRCHWSCTSNSPVVAFDIRREYLHSVAVLGMFHKRQPTDSNRLVSLRTFLSSLRQNLGLNAYCSCLTSPLFRNPRHPVYRSSHKVQECLDAVPMTRNERVAGNM